MVQLLLKPVYRLLLLNLEGHIILANRMVRLQVIKQIFARSIFDPALGAFSGIAKFREAASVVRGLTFMILAEKCLRLVLGVMLHIFPHVFGQIALTDLAL